jgi:hypothetical protein
MKHRNKRIGLNSDLFTHLSLYDTEWLKADCNKYQICAKWARGANGGKGTIPAEFNRLFASAV